MEGGLAVEDRDVAVPQPADHGLSRLQTPEGPPRDHLALPVQHVVNVHCAPEGTGI